jgi:virginiamycin B lyase
MKKKKIGLWLVILSLFLFQPTNSSALAEELIYNFYDLPSDSSSLIGSIALGPDGNMWFAKPMDNQVGRVTVEGEIIEYELANGSVPTFIAAGPDGNMWTTSGTSANMIHKISTTGQLLESYDIGSELNGMTGLGLAAGPDGNMWINAGYPNGSLNGKILKITPDGEITVYPVTRGGVGIAPGPDGNMWFSVSSSSDQVNYIGKITMDGAVTEYGLPGNGDGAGMLTAGPDGNMWYLRNPTADNKIGKITMDGQVEEFNLPIGALGYYGIAAGPNEQVWITEMGLNRLASVDMEGSITQYDLPVSTTPIAISFGSDENVWFSAQTKIGTVANTPFTTSVESLNQTLSLSTPTAPKSGALLYGVIVGVVALSFVLPAVYELRKARQRAGSSSH